MAAVMTLLHSRGTAPLKDVETLCCSLCTLQVIPVKNAKGTRLPVTACSYCPLAAHIVAGGEVRHRHSLARRVRLLTPPPDSSVLGVFSMFHTTCTVLHVMICSYFSLRRRRGVLGRLPSLLDGAQRRLPASPQRPCAHSPRRTSHMHRVPSQ